MDQEIISKIAYYLYLKRQQCKIDGNADKDWQLANKLLLAMNYKGL